MILAQDVLRWITVKALRHRTWAGSRVFDAPAQPSDLRMEADRATFVSVFTDDSLIKLDGNSLNAGDAAIDLVIEVAVADQTTIVPDEGDRDPSDPDIDRPPATSMTTKLATTDEGLEATIGFVAAQCAQALMAADNPWAELWRLMAYQREQVTVRRGGPLQEGREEPAVRYASRVLRMRLHVVADPIWGEALEPGTFWYSFLEAAEADAEMQGIAKIVRAHIEYPGDPIPSWQIQQAIMMVTQKGIVRMGIAPLVGEDMLAPDIAEAPVGTQGFSHDIDTDLTTTVKPDEDGVWPPEPEPVPDTYPMANTVEPGAPAPPPAPLPVQPSPPPAPSKWEQEGQP